jgi:hypothetical protein
MTIDIPEKLSFEQAIEVTQSLLEKMKAGQLKTQEIETAITSLVKSENGARGFFVTYLTDEDPLADRPSAEVIDALKTSPEIVGELLVKNLVMSTAMAITHRRNEDEAAARGSEQVSQRTKDLIKKLPSETIVEKLSQMKESIQQNQGEYTTFLNRWKYDTEQREAMYKTLSSLED